MDNFSWLKFHTLNIISDDMLLRYINSGVEEKYWIKYDNKEYLIKLDDANHLGMYELLCSKLAKKFNFPCINCYPAKMGERYGIIVESFLDSRTIREISFEELDRADNYNISLTQSKEGMDFVFNDTTFKKVAKKFKDKGYVLQKDVQKGLQQMILVDFLLAQSDRHSENISFLLKYDEKKDVNYLELSPMFDNGRMLGAVKLFNGKTCALYSLKDIQAENTNNCSSIINLDVVAQTLAKQVIKKDYLKQIYKNFLNVDLYKELGDIEKFCGYNLEEERKQECVKILNKRIKMISYYMTKNLTCNIDKVEKEEIKKENERGNI